VKQEADGDFALSRLPVEDAKISQRLSDHCRLASNVWRPLFRNVREHPSRRLDWQPACTVRVEGSQIFAQVHPLSR
jgi:hypothetical protein